MLIEIRPGSKADSNDVVKISEDILGCLKNRSEFNWPPEVLKAEFESVLSLVLFFDKKIVGFVCYRELPDELEISVLATDLKFQRRGFQTKILVYLQDLAAKQQRDLILEVHSQNLSAEALYSKLGFRVVSKRLRYYSDFGDAIVMKWISNKASC